MFRVYFVNHDYFSQNEAATLEEAKDIVRKAGFEAAIYRGERVVMTWDIFGGFRVR